MPPASPGSVFTFCMQRSDDSTTELQACWFITPSSIRCCLLSWDTKETHGNSSARFIGRCGQAPAAPVSRRLSSPPETITAKERRSSICSLISPGLQPACRCASKTHTAALHQSRQQLPEVVTPQYLASRAQRTDSEAVWVRRFQ